MSDVVQSLPACPNCDTPLQPKASYCAKCGMRSPGTGPFQQPGFGSSPPLPDDYQRTEIGQGTVRSFSIASLLIVITVIGVLLGITVQAPGLGILLALLAVPPWIRTALVIRRQRAMGIQPTTSDRVALFMGSMFVTWVVLFSLVAACCVTFFFACLGAFAITSGGGNESFIWIFIWSCILAVAGTLLFLFSFWIRARWRRHTDINRLRK